MRKSTTIFLLLFVSFCVKSANIEWKSAYLITHEQDTIYGEIGKRDNGEDHLYCLFRKDAKSESRTYLPSELLAYGTEDGLLYYALEIETPTVNETYFVQFLLEGIVNLYYYEFPEEKIHYYILERKGVDRMIQVRALEGGSSRYVEKQRMRNTIGLYLGDCPEITRDVERLRGSRNDIIKLLEKYHSVVCDDEVCIIYAEKKPQRSHYLEVYAGGILNFISLDNYGYVGRKKKVNPEIGVDYAVSLDPFSTKWLFHLSLGFSTIDFKNTKDFYKTHPVNFSAIKMNNNIMVQYRYLSSTVKPSFLLGLNQEVIVSHKNYFKKDKRFVYNYGVDQYALYRGSGNVMSYDKYGMGILLGVGMVIPVNNQSELPIRLIYHRGLFRAGEDYYPFLKASNYLSLSVGYSFKLN